MKTLVTITIDTEFSSHPEDMGIFGRIDGKEYGVPLLQQLLNEHNFKATFFTDVYTIHQKYLEAFMAIGRQLKKEGHDLELHTHPNGLFDPKRYGMKDYTLDEQIEIIRKGKELFKKWFDVTVTAHRAGDWAANYDTLKALVANDILIDSSMFFGWRRCSLNDPALTKNNPQWQGKLLEIPASMFECVPLKVFSPYRLISTDGNSFEETKALFLSLHQKGIKVINIVYHSFSFIGWNKARTQYHVAHNRIKKFKNLLNYLSKSPIFEVKTISEVGQLIQANALNIHAQDFVPKRGMLATFDRIIDRTIK